MPPSNRQLWYADVLRAGLDTAIFDEPDILTHATPAVLIGALPKDVLVKVLDATLSTGAMSPEAVVQTVGPEILAEHVPSPVIWACFVAAAERAGIPSDGASSSGSREFLRRALDRALAHGVAAAKDVVEDVDAKVIGHCFPDALTTKLLEASLAAGRMNPELILETLGVDDIARHAPTKVVWSCLARTGAPQAGAREATATAAAASAPVSPTTPAASAPVSPAAPAAAEPPGAPLFAAPPALAPSVAPPPTAAPPPATPPPTAAPQSAAPQSAAPAPAAAPNPVMDLFNTDDEPSVYVELDDSSGTMEVTRDKDEPLAAAPAAADGKKPGTARHTTRRA
jgi:hypothetical protein